LPAPALAVRHSLTSAPLCEESGSHNKSLSCKATHLHSIFQTHRTRVLQRPSHSGLTHSFVTRSIQHQQQCRRPMSRRCLARQCSSNCRRLDRYCHMLDPDDPNIPSQSASAVKHFSLGLHIADRSGGARILGNRHPRRRGCAPGGQNSQAGRRAGKSGGAISPMEELFRGLYRPTPKQVN
jgi:hypothetical protein